MQITASEISLNVNDVTRISELHAINGARSIGYGCFIFFNKDTFNHKLANAIAVRPASPKVRRTIDCIIIRASKSEYVAEQLFDRGSILRIVSRETLLNDCLAIEEARLVSFAHI